MPSDRALRDLFPALTKLTYLNTAGGAPIPDTARRAAMEYYQQSFDDGDVHWDTWMARVDDARRETGRLVGSPADHVAFVGNASVGLNLASLLDKPGKFAHAPTEFPSCTLPWLKRGFTPVCWPTAEDGSFDGDDVSSVLDQVSVVVLSWVQFTSGFRAPLEPIARSCAEKGVRLVVDATQAVAAFPVDAQSLGIDVLVFSGYKWLTAGYGVAGLVFPKGLPESGSPLAGWRSQENPYALVADRLDSSGLGLSAEAGHPPFPNVFALRASAQLWNREDPTRTQGRIMALMKHLHRRVDALGLPLKSTRLEDGLSGIALLGVNDPPAVAASLRERGIVTSARGTGLRVSVHAYNSEDDVNTLARALADLS